MTLNLDEIEARANARPGEENFDPAYMYKNPHADVTNLIQAVRERDETIKDLVAEVKKLSKGIDDVYNHNEASRAAVILHFGIHHDYQLIFEKWGLK